MKKIPLLLLTLTLILILPGCKKHVEGSIPIIPDDSISTTPTQTDVGTPVGSPVTKTIGKAGGSIESADGNAELIFPADALEGNTSISIQAVTQTAPNGVGHGYKFLPDGIRFRQPVIVKFHYTADDLAATLGDLMGIAFQDSIGGWWRVNNFTNDTVNKIISAPIKHFTAYTAFRLLVIIPGKGDVKVNESKTLSVEIVESDDYLLDNLKGDGEMVAPLIKSKNKTVVWSVNGVEHGTPESGTIAESNALTVSFKAPKKVPKRNPVAVSATIDITFTYNGKTYSKGKGTLLSNIRIIDGEKYLLQIIEIESPPFFEYKDSASVMLLVNTDGTVTIEDISNFHPETTPASFTQDDCTITWVDDGVGTINITGVTGKISSSPGNPDRQLILTFTHAGTVTPVFSSQCSGSDASTDGGFKTVGNPTQLSIELSPGHDFYTLREGHTLAFLALQN
jgi:hypothetical protein